MTRRQWNDRYRLARTLAADGTAIPGEDPTPASCIDLGRNTDTRAEWCRRAADNRRYAHECIGRAARAAYIRHAYACLKEARTCRTVPDIGPIVTPHGARLFLATTPDGWHPEESAADLVNVATGRPLYAADEAERMDAAMEECFAVLGAEAVFAVLLDRFASLSTSV